MRKSFSSARPASFRSYRRPSSHAGETSFQIVVEQTDLWITAREPSAVNLPEEALHCVNALRAQISGWILVQPEFAVSLTPVSVPPHAPEIIRRMAKATCLMGVGPMAAVAGAVATMTAEHLLHYSPDMIVENGGDAMLYSTRERIVGLLPDPDADVSLGIRMAPEDFPVSLCSSSATIGHSLSLGQGELAVVRARDACLADAAVTVFANMLHGPNDVEKATRAASAYAPLGVEGLFVQCKGAIGIWGKMELEVIA